MSYRFMRLIVFFDLPTETSEDKRDYRDFRKCLLNNGFIMMQESVYCRMLINPQAGKAVMDTIRKNKPEKGLVQVLSVTEKQFVRMEYLVGEASTDVITGDEKVIIL